MASSMPFGLPYNEAANPRAGLAYRSGNYRYLPALLHVSRNDTKYQDIN